MIARASAAGPGSAPPPAPSPADHLVELGIAHRASHRQSAAAEALRAALAMAPGHVAAWHHLGQVRRDAGDDAGAAVSHRRVVSRRPDFLPSLTLLGAALSRLGRADEATAVLRRGSAIEPSDTPTLREQAVAHERQGRPSRALASYRRLLMTAPADLVGLVNIANLMDASGRLELATAAIRRAAIAHPGEAAVVNNYAARSSRTDSPSIQRRWIARTLAIRPDHFSSHANLVMAALYDPSTTATELFDMCRTIAGRFADHVRPLDPPRNRSRDPERRLKIGYLSADLRTHPVAFNIENVLRALDRSRFEVHAFAHVPHPDATTRRLMAIVDRWHPIQHLPDDAVARLVRDEAIDLLVIVAGWTANNRPLVASFRPAPVQISFGDLTTSGMRAIDYWITDPHLHPPTATCERFTERLVRLPVFEVHRPPDSPPDVGPPPESAGAPLTFGSFNNPRKIGVPVVELWSRILRAVPGARLMLRFRNEFGVPQMTENFHRRFARHGIAAERLSFIAGIKTRADHLATLNHVDIALDPFPFNGSTTTFEALYMGVPVVTLAGERFVGRVGASFLAQVGLDDLVARDADHYVEIAVRLAADRERRRRLRLTLRRRVLDSPLCDAPGYARALEKAFTKMWRHRYPPGQ